MKREFLKKILYILFCLFLLCNFLYVSDNNQSLSGYGEQVTISIPVSNGSHMEIKTEENNLNFYVNLKSNSYKSLDAIKVIFFVTVLTALCGICLRTYDCRVSLHEGLFNYFTILYIHKKDGRKRF